MISHDPAATPVARHVKERPTDVGAHLATGCALVSSCSCRRSSCEPRPRRAHRARSRRATAEAMSTAKLTPCPPRAARTSAGSRAGIGARARACAPAAAAPAPAPTPVLAPAPAPRRLSRSPPRPTPTRRAAPSRSTSARRSRSIPRLAHRTLRRECRFVFRSASRDHGKRLPADVPAAILRRLLPDIPLGDGRNHASAARSATGSTG